MSTRVLMVFDLPYAVKPDYDFAAEFADPDGSYTENDVYRALLECGATFELTVITYSAKLHRRLDDQTGLKLLEP